MPTIGNLTHEVNVAELHARNGASMISHLLKSFLISNPADLDMKTYPGVYTISNFSDISQVAARSEVNKYWTSILVNYDVGRRDIIMGTSKTAKIFKPAERESLRDLRYAFRIKFPFVLTDGHLVTEGAVVAFKACSGEMVVNFANTVAILGSVIMVLKSLTPSHRGGDGVTCLDKVCGFYMSYKTDNGLGTSNIFSSHLPSNSSMLEIS